MAGLPVELNGFVGRRAEMSQAKRLLNASRLVTLAGPGGVGKTRLSLHLAQGLRRAFPDGIWFVELAALEDPALVANAVAAGLDLPDTSGQDPAVLLEARLASLQSLVILDNCEHVVAAAADLVERLLARAEGSRFLVTSREPLGVTGEHVMVVPPLSVPDEDVPLTAEPANTSDAVALLVERASAMVPGFRLGPDNREDIVRLCQRLDGLPLAIELAAARLRVFSVDQILARLDRWHSILDGSIRGMPARHRTLQAAVEWSFDLCPELEQTLWTRLSVFAGSFDLEAAENVGAGPGVAVSAVLDGVAGLVQKSVLLREEAGTRARYRMLETIRAFGRQRLAATGEEPLLRRRHRDHFLGLAQQAEADWFGPRQAEWLGRFQVDQPDIRAALGSSLADAGAAGELCKGAELAGALWWFWVTRAVQEGRQWLDRVEAAGSGGFAKARWTNGWLAIAHGDAASSVSLLGGPPDGVSILEQAVEDYRDTAVVDARSGLAWCNLPTVAGLLGDPDRAVAVCHGWLRICAAAGERWARSWALWVLAIALWDRGEPDEAHEHAMESLRLKRVLGDQLGLPSAITLLAWFATQRGDADRAAFLFGASESLWEPIGPPVLGWGTLRDWAEQWRARTRDILGSDAFESARVAGREAGIDTAMAHVLHEPIERPVKSATSPESLRLTRREGEVADLVAAGRSNKEIAAALVISQRTAETHVEHILSKLGFTSRAQIAAWVTGRR